MIFLAPGIESAAHVFSHTSQVLILITENAASCSMTRFSLLTLVVLSIVPLASGAGSSTPQPSPSPTPPKPNVAVSFDRQSLRENDAVQAWIRFANEWDQSLANVNLQIDSPSFLSWRVGACGDWKSNLPAATGTVNVGAVVANHVRVTPVCFRSGPDVMVGDFNVSFTFDYYWTGKSQPHSFVTSEKTLKANLFGSDSVAGIPIALAAFIVPGLFFWLVVGWLKVPWNVGDGLGDKLIYSLLVSFALLWLLEKLQVNASTSISIQRLGVFAGVGAISGAAVGGSSRLISFGFRKWRESKATEALAAQEQLAAARKAREVKLGDPKVLLLEKLLELYPNHKTPRAVISRDGIEYEGTLMSQTEDVTALIGSFRILKTEIKGPDRAAIIQELSAATTSFERYKIAVKHQLEIEPFDSIIATHEDKSMTEESVSMVVETEGTAAQQFQDGGKEPLIFD